MLSSIKVGWRAWFQSLGILACSPAYFIALAVISGLWGLAGYKWLGLPESSALVLMLALVWILALAALALATLCGTVASVSAVALGSDRHLCLSKILNFEKKRFGWSALTALAGLVLGLVLGAIFTWINGHALDAASFLTFHAQHPVSYILIGKILWIIEALIWVAFAGFLMTWLLAFSNPGQFAAAASSGQARSHSFGVIVFLTSVVSAAVFGGPVWLLAAWHPIVKAGGWDYAQLGIRTCAALLLLSLGWLSWALALARLTLSPATKPAAPPPRS